MKKIFNSIRIFFFYLFVGFKNVNDNAFTGNKDTDGGNGSNIEQQKEVQNVYKDMLKGELTQEVIELRHEMYFAERASKKYEYAGNGRAIKKNDLMLYKGSLECSDGLDVLLVQTNKEDIGSLMDFDIYNMGKNFELGTKAKGNLDKARQRKFTINIKRDYIATLKLEQYATKIVVKPLNEKQTVFDIYLSKYQQKFDNVHKLFLKQIEQIYMGDVRNEILDFLGLDFITYNAHGVDDLLKFEFENIKFENIIKFEDSYVLRFIGDNVLFGYDIVMEEMYDEQTDIKNKTHAPRNETIIDATHLFNTEENTDEDKNEEALKLLKEYND